jgi:hypothetical protein
MATKAEAIMSPSAIVAAGVGAAVVIATGLPIVVAPVAALAAWAARVALAMPRKPALEPIRPERLGDPWRTLVVQAVDADRRFRSAVIGCRPGPLREHLESIATRVDDGLRACWNIAQRGESLDHAVRNLDVDGTRAELAQVREDLRREPEDADLKATAASLQAQLDAATRLASTAGDARDKLRRLDAELEEAVARALELSLRATEVGQLGSLDSDVEGLVGELETLRAALEQTAS